MKERIGVLPLCQCLYMEIKIKDEDTVSVGFSGDDKWVDRKIEEDESGMYFTFGGEKFYVDDFCAIEVK